MKSILSALLLPMSIFWVLVLISGILYWRKKNKPSRLLGMISLLWLLVISTPFLPNALASYLENRYDVVSPDGLGSTNQPVNILVLGASHTPDERLPATDQLSEVALTRLVEGIRLHRLLPNSRLITSGSAGREGPSQAEVFGKAAVLLGVEEKNIVRLNFPKNTWTEALEYKRLLGDSAQLIVVTSAMHMPRSMKLFKKAGLQPVAAPTNYLIKQGKYNSSWNWIPSSKHINKMECAAHEYVGMVWANFEKQ